jgi:hypothetical protein
VDGARWVHEEILAAYPQAPLRVYAVWLDMVEGDARDTVDRGLLPDPRVIHLWDDGKRAGRFYAAFTRPSDPEWVEWDAFFVYPPGATWSGSATRPLAWGRTVIRKREELRAATVSLVR